MTRAMAVTLPAPAPVFPPDGFERAGYESWARIAVGDIVETRGRPWAVVTATDECDHPFHDRCTLLHRRPLDAGPGETIPPVHCTSGCHLWTCHRAVTP